MLNRCLVLLFFLSLHATSHAQWYNRSVEPDPKSNRIIATDYNECQMGIKDTLGNWIVKPQYVMIYEMESGDFKITDYNTEGVIDPNGRVIVPMIYYRVWPTYWSQNAFYTVQLGKRYGVIDRSGKMIIPCRYKEIGGNEDTTFNARVSWRKWYIIHRDGTRFLNPERSNWRPYMIDSSLFLMEKERWFLHNRYGLYDDSGNVVLRPKYFNISSKWYEHTLTISTRKHRGYFTTELDTLWPMIFDYYPRYRRGYWETYWFSPHLSDDGITAERINGKKGLINMKGDTILPFKYQLVDLIGYSGTNSVWRVRHDEHWGIFEAGKGWIVPLSLNWINSIAEYHRDADSSFVGVFTGEIDGKIGMQTTVGDIIVPYEFENIEHDGDVIHFLSKDSVVTVTFTSTITRHRLMTGSDTISQYSNRYDYEYSNELNEPHTRIPDNGHFNINEKEPGWKLYYHPGHLDDTLLHPRYQYPVPIDEKRKSNFPNRQLNASVFEVRTHKPKITLPEGGGVYFDFENTDHSQQPKHERFIVLEGSYDDIKYLYIDEVVETLADKQHEYYWSDDGLLFRDDNKILSNREYNSCSFAQSLPDSVVYFELYTHGKTAIMDGEGNYVLTPHNNVKVGDFNTSYAWIDTRPYKGKNHWKLIDTKTDKTVYDLGKSWRSYGDLRKDLIVDYSSKKGYFLFNVTQQKQVTAGYDQIRPADTEGELFFIRTCTGKHGMMNKAGNIVVDTLWNYFTPFSFYGGVATFNQWWDSYSVEPNYRYFVFYDNRTSVIYDVLNRTELRDKKMLVDSALFTTDTVTKKMLEMYGQEEEIPEGTIRIYIDSTDRLNLQPWHYTSIFDSVFTRKRLEYYDPIYNSFSSFTSCHYCGKKTKRYTYPAPNHYNDRNFYEVHFVSATAISLSGFNEYGTRRWYTNHVMTGTTVQPVTLQWLFDPRSDWRNYLINSVITYVNTHLNVTGDCHNPAGLPMLLNEDFLIGQNGIELYPEGFYENNYQLMIILPWKECSPYLLTSMKKALPVPAGM